MPVMDFPSSPINGQTTTDGRYYFDSSVGSSGAWRSTPLPVGGLPAGSIMAWGTNTPPANWLLADGSAVSRSVYSSLFAVIGTQYGAGDGTTTFNLPDLRGRVPVGRNGGTFGTLGATGGSENHVHGNGNLAAGGTFFTAGGAVYFDYNTKSTDSYVENVRAYWPTNGSVGALNPEGSSSGIAVYGSTSSSSSLAPYQVVNYIIKFSAGWTAGDSELATRVGSVEGRATALETANSTTNRAGLVPVVPSSVTVSSGSGSVAASGVVSFSGVGAVTLKNVFSATYDYYKFILTISSASNDADMQMQLGKTGLSNLSSGWVWARYLVYSGPTGAASFNNAANGGMFARVSVAGGMASGDLINPGNTLRKAYNSMSADQDFFGNFAGRNSTATAYEDIYLYLLQGGTFTGTLQILGYRK